MATSREAANSGEPMKAAEILVPTTMRRFWNEPIEVNEFNEVTAAGWRQMDAMAADARTRPAWLLPFACPHCGSRHGTAIPVCPDKDRWTQQERDELRQLGRSHFGFPASVFPAAWELDRLNSGR